MTTELACKLDWFSFTFPITMLGEKDNEYTLSHILSAFHDHTGQRLFRVVEGSLWTWVQSAGFYTHRIQHPKSHISISWNAGNPYALCELSGQSCDLVLQTVSTHELALSASGRATRLDFAVDIENDCTPEAFAALRNERAFRAYAFYTTETGDTVYIGSRKSDRMARVYRYNPPHPRAHLLRVEAEYKGDAAKMICDVLSLESLTFTTLTAHAPFGWTHELWQTNNVQPGKVAARHYNRSDASRLRWLNTVVAPAIKQAAQEGMIDLQEWIQEYLT